MKPVHPMLTPPVFALCVIIISAILHFYFPIKQIIYFPYTLLGINGIILGFLLSAWGGISFKKLKTPLRPGEKPKKIVAKGPFTFTRNPMYLGNVLILIGIAVLFGSLVAFISPIILYFIMQFAFILPEEKLMEKTFGKKYLEYKRKVRRWI
jgi:protein-S-isoprenylcysteine O-methyltransferase Ste14